MNMAQNYRDNRTAWRRCVSAIALAMCFCLNIVGVQALDSESGAKRDDYLDTILTDTKGKVFRYERMPVQVFIESQQLEERDACEQAFSLWHEGTDGLISFESVSDKAAARVLIKFVSLPQRTEALSNTASDGGHTLMEWHFRKRVLPFVGHRRVRVPPQIVEVNMSALDARPTSQRTFVLRNIIEHELGHAIGLLGHSPDPDDLMCAKTDENSKLSPRDLNTVRKLYRHKADVYL
ncbi:MAG: matrixin family metalloprotease [Candidatus Obscuribacterales bacterium]|nr:matrixin family metalloprotease [Candidatus Obscuribacterales bacterium]